MNHPFNTPLEFGIRVMIILGKVFPSRFDLQHLVYFDYFAVHSGDVNGPDSLHANLPYRSGELTIRRELIERGLLLMMSRGLVERHNTSDGFLYSATEKTITFIEMMSSEYIFQLQERVAWVVENLSALSLEELKYIEYQLFKDYSVQFSQGNQLGRQN